MLSAFNFYLQRKKLKFNKLFDEINRTIIYGAQTPLVESKK